MARFVRWCCRSLLWGLTLACAAALMIWTLLKDRVPYIATLYYAAPPALLAPACLAASIGWALRRRKRRALAFSLFAAILMWSATGVPLLRSMKDPGSDTLSIVMWNVRGEPWNAERVARWVSKYDPDVIGLVESGPNSRRARAAWRGAFPDYEVSGSFRGTTIISKKHQRCRVAEVAGTYGVLQRVTVDWTGTDLNLMLIDVKSNPLLPRGPSIREMTSIAESTEGPAILMGDFNTPVDSVHFSRLRESFKHAFESTGSGYAATWPLPIPVLQIDHVWVRGAEVVRCEHGWSNLSDHRPVIVHLKKFD